MKTTKEALIERVQNERVYYKEFLTLTSVLIEVLKTFENKTVNKRLITKINTVLESKNSNLRVSFFDFLSNLYRSSGYRVLKVYRYINDRYDYDFNNKDYYLYIFVENNMLVLDKTIQNINEFWAKCENDLIALNDAINNYENYVQMINDLNEHIRQFNLKRNKFICDNVYINL